MSLAAITQRANNIDFSAVLDAQGYPLHPRLANFLEDDAPHDPDREKKEIVDLLSNIQSDADALEAEMAATPGGMRCPLYDHQKIALNWMTKMETGTNKGGILGDDMGLGKTITTLALMLSRQSPTAVKTNLIIGPVALIKQWEQEIQKKLSPTHKLSVLLLHQKRKVAYSEIKRYDVALTTYGSIAAEWRAYEKHIEQRKASALYTEEADAELAKKCPLLHPRSKFYRIILDEAQCIKNKDTQGAKGVHKIDATYHWCLTGTPIMNNVTELYSLFRFLRIKPYCDFKLFQRAFKSLGPRNTSTDYTRSQAMEQLRVILQATMLRRMKDSKINGKPLLTLPPKTQHSELVQFSEEERQFYMDLETRSQVVLNRYLRANTVGKNYSNILVLLLRLRQACCHPHLTEFETVVPAEDDGSSLILAKGMDEDVVKRIKEKSLECPICWDAVDDPTILLPCGHFVCTECYSSLGDRVARQNISEGNEASGIRCPECRGNSTKSIKYNVFLNAHMPEKLGAGEEELADISDRENSDDEEDDRDSDNESVGSLADFVVDDNADELDDDDDARLDAELSAAVKLKKEKDSQSTKKVRKKTAKSKKGRKPKSKDKGKSKDEPIHPSQLKSLRDEASKNIAARRRYMKYLEDNWEDSAKVTKVIELLKEIQITDEKTIIFSQWTSLLDLVECQVKSKIPDVEYCRYTGKMSRAQRDEAVADFVENPKNRIMLVSLRAGNAGLNLTVASRVIICDPFWNPFIENQAVDRAHRIGQQREVQIHRILIQGTVEDRILTLQEQKRELVDSALGDGKDGQNARLNNAELRYLFGVGNLPGRL
ncbi:SWI/SNF family DNA-dependent ATPase [Podospora australis]|uniref:SWI/SNF family DNA-dependent ATPase n=1 Tax=Podospora australis TaxID=1536484 RepID=A0AAN6X344_9PEZI|nr:SWI/SNF family DNA-dependent ATPase [Podospora australis]